MNGRKLQVFVSSTYRDLRDERMAAVEAILLAGHIPAGMELFAAGDKSQWDTIRRWIDESDAYMLILGERYGTVDDMTGKSYTQLEYEYALTSGKRAFALVMSDVWVERKFATAGRSASDEYRTQHKIFKELVLTKISSFADDEKDIKISVGSSLRAIEFDTTLGGWVRAEDYHNSQALVVELRKTIEDLRARPVSGSPTAAEVDTEIEGRIAELRLLPIIREAITKFNEDTSEHKYRLESNMLAVVYGSKNRIPSDFTRGTDRDRAWDNMYLDLVQPLLEIWGFVDWEIRRGWALTSKGRLFMNKVNALDILEAQRARFVLVPEE